MADRSVPLRGDGHDHEDGAGHGDVAQRVQQVRERHGVPARWGELGWGGASNVYIVV